MHTVYTNSSDYNAAIAFGLQVPEQGFYKQESGMPYLLVRVAQ